MPSLDRYVESLDATFSKSLLGSYRLFLKFTKALGERLDYVMSDYFTQVILYIPSLVLPYFILLGLISMILKFNPEGKSS